MNIFECFVSVCGSTARLCESNAGQKIINYLKCRKGFDHSEMAFEFDIDTQLQLFQFLILLVRCRPRVHPQLPCKLEEKVLLAERFS